MAESGWKQYLVGGLIGAAMFAPLVVFGVARIIESNNESDTRDYCNQAGIEATVPAGYGSYSGKSCNDLLPVFNSGISDGDITDSILHMFHYNNMLNQ